MDNTSKLVEIDQFRKQLIDVINIAVDARTGEALAERIANHLIENGVTIPVRCKDCKHRRGDFFGNFVCSLHKGLSLVTDESFCSYGERKDNETD